LVIVPIALRLIVPPITNESLNLLKNSSVALTISVAELTFQTRQIETYTARAFEALTAGTLIYLVLCVSIAWVMSSLERRYAIPGLIARVGGPGWARDARPRRHRPQLQVPDRPGLPRRRQLRRRYAAPGHSGDRTRLRPGDRGRPGPARQRRLDSRAGRDVRRVLPRCPAGHGDLLVLVHHSSAPRAAAAGVRDRAHRVRDLRGRLLRRDRARRRSVRAARPGGGGAARTERN